MGYIKTTFLIYSQSCIKMGVGVGNHNQIDNHPQIYMCYVLDLYMKYAAEVVILRHILCGLLLFICNTIYKKCKLFLFFYSSTLLMTNRNTTGQWAFFYTAHIFLYVWHSIVQVLPHITTLWHVMRTYRKRSKLWVLTIALSIYIKLPKLASLYHSVMQ